MMDKIIFCLFLFILSSCVITAISKEEADACKTYLENVVKLYTEMVYSNRVPKCIYKVAAQFDWPQDLETKDPKYLELIRKQFLKMKDDVKDEIAICMKQTVENVLLEMNENSGSESVSEECEANFKESLQSLKEYFHYMKKL